MQVIHKAICNGKTRDLIELASENNFTIVCFNQNRKRHTKDLARKLGLEIPEPVTVEELSNEFLKGKKDIRIVVDDADEILQSFLNTKIYVITISK